MEQNLWLLVGLSSLTVSAATWGVCRWWFGRQLAAASDRMAKLEKARLFSSQQVMQARKQIEKLQKDMAGLQHRPVNQSSAPSRAAQVEAVLRTVDQIPARTSTAASGFADTQAFETT